MSKHETRQTTVQVYLLYRFELALARLDNQRQDAVTDGPLNFDSPKVRQVLQSP